MKLTKRAILMLCVMVGTVVLVPSGTQQVSNDVYTAGAVDGVKAVFSDFYTAAQELWEIAHTNDLGVWHLVVVVLAILVPRKIIVLLLR